MENNYEFWEKYLEKVKNRINKICDTKKDIYIDLHIHSNYSSDSEQKLEDIIKITKEKGFDFISITDHDSLEVYDSLFNIVKKDLTNPLIIPGVEFTIDNKEYGNQCHILQLFINPKDDNIMKDINKNYKATYTRSKIQFKRLKENKAIKELKKTKNLKFSYSDYLKYLNENLKIPEYDTIASYLMKVLKSKNITTFDVLKLLEKYNELDCYSDRRQYKKNRFEKLKGKYPYEEKNYFNSHFLLSMLAVREVDDDWWPSPSSGSLSVNSYGQLKLNELNKKFPIFWAHPTEEKLDIVQREINRNKNIIGLEKNIRNKITNIESFTKVLLNNSMHKIIGSDSHDNSNANYDDMSYFKINSTEFKKIIKDIYEKN